MADPVVPAQSLDPPGQGQWIITTDDVLSYVKYVDLLAVATNQAATFWQTDPPGCPTRCILAFGQWNQNMGVSGPWQLWYEGWRDFALAMQTSYWARINGWDSVTQKHKELLGFLQDARALGLPNVPADKPLPSGPYSWKGLTDEVSGAAAKTQGVLDDLVILGLLAVGVFAIIELRKK